MHQPVDNFSDAVDRSVELCYAPFFETMRKYPEFKFALHSSGWLLSEIKTKYPKLFSNIEYLTNKGSIEWVGGGYYEPVLSSISSKDAKAQIEKLNLYLQKNLKATPKGSWLTERVWEASVIEDLKACGLEYVVVDDYHFLSNGFDANAMDGYYESEKGGEKIALFPISSSLRYALPFFNIERAIEEILKCAQNKNSAAVIFDDMEKFGLWPKTHEWVYEKKWLERFVEAVVKDERIVTMHYKEYLQTHHSKGLAYLSNTSYFEMGEWSLGAVQAQALERLKQRIGEKYFQSTGVAFIKGGIWKNFFLKYHESNHIHKRMLRHSLHQERLKKNILDSLYKLQTNDVFWHGLFGGIYLPNLRDNAYKYLLEIEASLATKKIKMVFEDIDMDGYKELKVLTKDLSLVFSSKYGGSLVEFGSLEKLFNWQNTLMRRYEAYHEKILNPPKNNHIEKKNSDTIATIHNADIVVDAALKDKLIYDWHPKYSFVDHFSRDEFLLDSFKRANFKEVGDFANQPFEFDEAESIFKRDGGIFLDKKYETSLVKKYSFASKKIALKLGIATQFTHKLYYGMEFNFHFAHPHKVSINAHSVEEGIILTEVENIVLKDDYTQKNLKITTDKKCTLYAYIADTISQSEEGFELIAQQVSLLIYTSFSNSLDLNISLEVCDV